MNPALPLASRTFPSRIADLGFTANLPADWIAHDLPGEEPDFANPAFFFPLAIVTAPHAAIAFAFAARPAHDDGTLHDWAMYHLGENQLQPRAVGRGRIAGVPAVIGEAMQQSEVGPVVVRFAFIEDGDRLLNLTLTAPELFADTVRDAWFGMVQTFTLETPRGSRFPLEEHPDETPAAPIPEPWMDRPPEPPRVPQPDDEEPEADTPAEPEDAAKEYAFSDFALADDAASLDPDATINANLRDRGAGLVPNVMATDAHARRATLAAGAIMAIFDVPFGWHVIDDGKRTLVLDPGGKIQINLSLIPLEGCDNDVLLDEIEAQMRRDYPEPEFMRMHMGRIHALGARRIADGAQPIEQYHLLFPHHDEAMVLRARVTVTPEKAKDACNLAELILNSCNCDISPDFIMPQTGKPRREEQPAGGGPEWWRNALALEAQDRCEEAEQVIREACPHLGFASSTAEMYRLRMLRLKQAGDQPGALAAFRKSSDFIWSYASMATSGGEGAALSLERDEFRARLVAEYGSDPEAP
jgi:hypothetical protein